MLSNEQIGSQLGRREDHEEQLPKITRENATLKQTLLNLCTQTKVTEKKLSDEIKRSEFINGQTKNSASNIGDLSSKLDELLKQIKEQENTRALEALELKKTAENHHNLRIQREQTLRNWQIEYTGIQSSFSSIQERTKTLTTQYQSLQNQLSSAKTNLTATVQAGIDPTSQKSYQILVEELVIAAEGQNSNYQHDPSWNYCGGGYNNR